MPRVTKKYFTSFVSLREANRVNTVYITIIFWLLMNKINSLVNRGIIIIIININYFCTKRNLIAILMPRTDKKSFMQDILGPKLMFLFGKILLYSASSKRTKARELSCRISSIIYLIEVNRVLVFRRTTSSYEARYTAIDTTNRGKH